MIGKYNIRCGIAQLVVCYRKGKGLANTETSEGMVK